MHSQFNKTKFPFVHYKKYAELYLRPIQRNLTNNKSGVFCTAIFFMSGSKYMKMKRSTHGGLDLKTKN